MSDANVSSEITPADQSIREPHPTLHWDGTKKTVKPNVPLGTTTLLAIYHEVIRSLTYTCGGKSVYNYPIGHVREIQVESVLCVGGSEEGLQMWIV